MLFKDIMWRKMFFFVIMRHNDYSSSVFALQIDKGLARATLTH